MRSVRHRWMLCLLASLAWQGISLAQDKPPVVPKEPPKFFKLEFVVEEVDGGKVINSRTYTTSAATDGSLGSIRTGSQVAVPASPGSAQFTVANVGVDIDYRNLREEAGEMALTVKSQVRSAVPEAGPPASTVIRHNEWESAVVVPIGKATVIFSSDDVATKHRMQMELKATPIQ